MLRKFIDSECGCKIDGSFLNLDLIIFMNFVRGYIMVFHPPQRHLIDFNEITSNDRLL